MPDLSNETVLYIAEAVTDNVCSIIGALKRLHAAHDLEGVELSNDIVKSILLQAEH